MSTTKMAETLDAIDAAWASIPEEARQQAAQAFATAAIVIGEGFSALRPHLEVLEEPGGALFALVLPRVLLSTDRGARIEELADELGGRWPVLGALYGAVNAAAAAVAPVAGRMVEAAREGGRLHAAAQDAGAELAREDLGLAPLPSREGDAAP